MQQKPSAPLPATLPALPEFLPALLPAYCRDEVIGDLAEQYARKVQLLGRPTADKRLRGEVLGVLARLPWLWLRQHEIVQGPLHWQPIRLARVAAKRTELWYCCTAALRSAGQPVQTLRIIVYDKQRDAFLATRTREVGAGLMPPRRASRSARLRTAPGTARTSSAARQTSWPP